MFDWAEYLNLADALAGQSNQAALRSAVSRAYYAAFHRASQKLIDEQQIYRSDPTQPRKHKAIWDMYRDSTDANRQRIGVKGDRLRKNRTDADYNDAFITNITAVTSCIGTARSLCKSIDQL